MNSLTILIPTVVDRAEKFQRLVDCLAPQIIKYGGDVQVLVLWNNYERQIGAVRQKLLEEADSSYVVFIDDDDLVTDDYVDTIYPLLDGVDYIGYKVAFYDNGRKVNKPVIHSIKNTGWYDDDSGFYRRGVHINPVLRKIALKGRYDMGDYRAETPRPEDETYHKNIDKYLKTENFIDREMYIYHQTDDHAFGKFIPLEGEFKKPILPKYFKYHPESTET